MEIIKSILALISSFFQSKKAESVIKAKEVSITETAIVETIRATENAVALEQKIKLETELHNLEQQQKVVTETQSKKPINEQLDEQFGSNE